MSDDTTNVLVILTVPAQWAKLPIPEIARKLRGNEPHLSTMLASEVKRWAGVGAVDITALKKFVDERMGTQ